MTERTMEEEEIARRGFFSGDHVAGLRPNGDLRLLARVQDDPIRKLVAIPDVRGAGFDFETDLSVRDGWAAEKQGQGEEPEAGSPADPAKLPESAPAIGTKADDAQGAIIGQ